MKTTTCDVKNTLDGINGRWDTAKKKRLVNWIQSSRKDSKWNTHRKENLKKWTEHQWVVGKFKWHNLNIIGVTEGEKETRGNRKIFEEIMAQSFPNLMKIINWEIQGTQQTPSTRNMKQVTPRHITIKFLNISDKENILTAERKHQRKKAFCVQRNKDKTSHCKQCKWENYKAKSF